MRISAFFAVLFLISSLASAQTTEHTAQTTAHWDYYGKTGPLGWGKLDPAYRACSEGKEQSPIDIRGAHLNRALPPIEFHYIGTSVEVDNNGHTIEIHVRPGSYITVNGVRYDLQQFHFHHPSEEAVNGKLADMSAHLVHKSADGKLAVIAVRLSEERGDPNAALASLWEHLPTTPGATDKVTDMINPAGLLPGDRGYWTYVGSLTTPPCTEGVRWFVLEQTLSISRAQLQAFARLYKIDSRPLQDTHGRRIEANE
jgi:carbonic anhydrase